MMLPEFPAKYIYIFLGFIGFIFVANILLLDYFFIKQRGDLLDFQTRITQLADSFKILGGRLYTGVADENSASVLPIVNNNVCPTSCVDLITLSATAGGRQSTASLVNPNLVTTTTTVVSKGEFFVPMGSGSVSQTNDWTNIDSAQATFDASNFGSIKAAYFEAFLHTQSGEVHARLFDTSTPAVFFSSDLKSSSMTTQYLSAPIALSPGSKVYKVQMYSTIGSGFLDQARIRIVTQ